MSSFSFKRRALVSSLGVLVAAGCPGDDGVAVDGTTDSSGTGVTTFTGGTTGPTTTLDSSGATSLDTTATTMETDSDSETESESDTDSGTGPIDPPGRTIVCDNEIAPAPKGQVCGVTPGSTTMLLQGTVLAGFDIYENGTVLVDTTDPNGRIECVGCDCGETTEGQMATVVACADGVITPGLINPHDHITFTLSQPQGHGTERYDHRHEWRLGLDGATELNTFPGSDSSREGVLYGELRMLLGGATSISGSVGGANASGLIRNLDRAELTEGLAGVDVNYRTFPLGDSNGTMLEAGCGYPFIDGTFNLNDDIYMPHIAEGITDAARNEFTCLAGGPGGEDLIEGNTSVIHGIGMRPTDIDVMGQEGAMLVWSPRSNVDLYGITADVTAYRNLGVRIALGTDWTASGSMNMLRELACADQFNTNHLNGAFSDAELWLMSTYWAAASQGADDQIGLIAPGHIADLAIFDGSDNGGYRAIIEGQPEDVALVMRGGQPLHGETQLMDALVSPADIGLCETIDVCGTTKRMCAQLDAGLTTDQIISGVSPSAYPLFFCGDPDDEPSCDPARRSEFPDRGGPDDADGDGIADGEDNCPNIFNPTRPLDSGLQADSDADGLGDVCDLCPLEAGEACTVPNVFDQDGDGIEDPADNCVLDENADQDDSDADGQGDACDACPDVPNPGGGPCPASIYEIKDGTVVPGEFVNIPDVVVTAASPDAPGFFVQMHPDDKGYMGVDFSGMYVYTAGNFTPEIGDRVALTGSVNDFFGQIQLDASDQALNVLSSGNPLPEPEPTTPSDIVEMGPLQAELEGVLVSVSNVTVNDVNPAPGPGDDATNEFEVDDGLRVNDLFYVVQPFPLLGQPYSRIFGVARWANGFTKLEPRFQADYPATLVSFGDAQSYLLLGATAEPVPGLEVVLSAPAAGDTVIDLTYADAAIVSGPATVTVLDGTTSAVVELTGVAPGIADVQASYEGVDLATSVRVYDDAEPRIPTVTPLATTVSVGQTVDLTLNIDLPAEAGGTVGFLSGAPGTCVTWPLSVTVPEGELSVDFTVTALDCIGDETVIVSIGGFDSPEAVVTVVDAPVFDNVVIVEAYYDHPGGDDTFEWVKLYNGTGAPVDLAGFSIGHGGTDYTYGGLDLAGVIPDGSCFVVGGPAGDADSGFAGGPMFDQAADFNPDIQNSGATADGIALFDVNAAAVTPATIPIDAVIYGTDNANGLIDETGAASAVEVGDAPATDSIRRLSDGSWIIEPNPAPLDCVPFPEP